MTIDTQRTERFERHDLDLTPTTTPSWVAGVQLELRKDPPPVPVGPRGKRLARGTIPPALRHARVPMVPRPAPVIEELPSRLVPPPRAWGRVVRVDLEGAPITHTRVAAPRRRVSPTLLAGVLAAAIVPLAILLASSTPPKAHAPVVVAAPVVAAVVEPTVTPILAPGEGLLAIASTPPCRILIDGHDTGLATPQRELRLPAGHHRITLVDDAHGLEDHSEVEVGESPASVTRDLSAFVR